MQVWKRLLQKEKGSKNKEQQKLSVVFSISPRSCPRWDRIVPGSWQGFSSSDIHFRDCLPFPATDEEGSRF